MTSKKVKLKEYSRYQRTPLYQMNDQSGRLTNVFSFGRWERIDFPASDADSVYTVAEHDLGRLDILAYRFYGSTALWWVIAHVNGITDQFIEDRKRGGMKIGMPLRIPARANVVSILSKQRASSTSRPLVPTDLE